MRLQQKAEKPLNKLRIFCFICFAACYASSMTMIIYTLKRPAANSFLRMSESVFLHKKNRHSPIIPENEPMGDFIEQSSSN
jgi:hypothetical protein